MTLSPPPAAWILGPASLLLGILGACAAPTPAPLVAASNFLHPPFSSLDAEGRPVGIEVDLVADAARRLGREVVWVERSFGELLDAVAQGEVDLAASTIGITDERRRLVAFSVPYFETSIVALVRAGTGEPRSLDELAGRRVSTERGTTSIAAVARRIPTAVRVLDREDGATWARMLGTGRIDAVVLDLSHADTFVADAREEDAGAQLQVLGEPIQRERFGIATQPGASELLGALDAAILAAGSEPRP